MRSAAERIDARFAWICAGAVLAAIAASIPIAECGVNDDWSYTKTALDLATTGHLVYNGWAAAMLGIQAYWGALFINVFGFSFLAVRLSMAPVGAACGALLYALHRRAHLPPGLALFGTLTVVLSPVFVVTAPTFMTDIPALLLLLASVYGYVRFDEAIRAMPPRGAGSFPGLERWAWALAGLAAGVLGGTVRQVVWLVPLLGSGYLLVRYAREGRMRRAIAAPLAVSGLAALAAMLYLSNWFERQPYAVYEAVSPSLVTSRADAGFVIRFVVACLLQTLGVLLLPAFLALPAMLRERLAGFRYAWGRLAGALVLAFAIWLVLTRYGVRSWILIWLGMAYSACPYMYSVALAPFTTVPTTLPLAVWNAISVVTSIAVSVVLAVALSCRFWPHRESVRPARPPGSGVVVGLLAVFSIAYLGAVVVHALMINSNGINDRYLLPVLPLATIVFLGAYRDWTARVRVPAACWVLLAGFSFYGVASAHDYFAQLRARLAVTRVLEERGIARTRIMGGSEYDAWTQITVGGYYNDPRIRIPEGSYVRRSAYPGFLTIYHFWSYTPVVRPEYVVALAPHPELHATDVPAVEYQCWLPPLRRRLVVQARDPALAAILRARAGPASP